MSIPADDILETGVVPEWTLGDRLRKARARTGLNTRDFAERIGVSHGTITNAEGDKRGVRTITIRAWALATGVDVNWLVTGENPRPGDPDGGEVLPRLDLNQRPSDYMSSQVSEIPHNVIQGPWQVPA